MTSSKVIETDRLILREPTLEHWPGFFAILSSDRARFMGGPYSAKDAWGDFCHGVASWRLFGVGSLSIVSRSTGAYLGQIEINQGPRFPEPELGWQLAAEAEGQDFAFEAATAMRDWVLEQRTVETLVSYIDPENVRSINLAERLGARLDQSAIPQDPGDLVYRHVSPS